MISIKRCITITLAFIVLLLSSCTDSITKEVDKRYLHHEGTRLKEYENNKIQRVYIVHDDINKELIQIVKEEGFVDKIELLIIINCLDESIQKVEVLKHNETNDYGGLLTEEWFLNRFKNKGVDKDLLLEKMTAKEDNEIVAITGATKTSQGVINGVNLAIRNFKKMRGERL